MLNLVLNFYSVPCQTGFFLVFLVLGVLNPAIYKKKSAQWVAPPVGFLISGLQISDLWSTDFDVFSASAL